MSLSRWPASTPSWCPTRAPKPARLTSARRPRAPSCWPNRRAVWRLPPHRTASASRWAKKTGVSTTSFCSSHCPSRAPSPSASWCWAPGTRCKTMALVPSAAAAAVPGSSSTAPAAAASRCRSCQTPAAPSSSSGASGRPLPTAVRKAHRCVPPNTALPSKKRATRRAPPSSPGHLAAACAPPPPTRRARSRAMRQARLMRPAAPCSYDRPT